jgi:very-short-patch-repair endonuclease
MDPEPSDGFPGMPSDLARKAVAATRLARAQHGLISRRQALRLGYSDSAIGRLIESGRWQRRHRGIYALLPPADPERSQLMGLALRAPWRVWASHRSAAKLWGLDGTVGTVEVSTTVNLRDRRARIHYVSAIDPVDARVVDGIPVTSVERTLVDLGSVVGAVSVDAAVSDALRRGLTTTSNLRDRARELAACGRRGPRHLLNLLDSWEGGSVPESVLESMFLRLVRRQRLPPPVRQLEVRDRGALVARVDFAYPRHMVAIEVDGYRWHGGSPERWRADVVRQNALVSLGWHVLRFTWADVKHDPARVAASIRSALTRASSVASSR